LTGILRAISAAKAGVPINAMAAIAVASFFMAIPRSNNDYHRKMASIGARGDIPQISGLCCSVATR
jgi:hypothetical protein